MEKLRALQKNFVENISKGNLPSVEVMAGGSLTSKEALGVYVNAYPARLTEQLQETYEGIWWVLGDEGFFRVCEGFIRKHPSHSYNLSDYGKSFGTFVLEEWNEFPFLAELGGFEWNFKNIFHAQNIQTAREEEFQKFSPLSQINFGESVKFLNYRYRVLDIWQKRKEETEGANLDWNRPQSIILFKRKSQVEFLEISGAQGELGEQLANKKNLEEALEEMSLKNIIISENEMQDFFQMIRSLGLVEGIE